MREDCQVRVWDCHCHLRGDETGAYGLEQMDVPLIDDCSRETIYAHASAIYTARPSLPPEGNAGLYQTPEAEIALQAVRICR